ncbi:MAG: putative Ig domain-containing protein [Planctomycetota bacterium]
MLEARQLLSALAVGVETQVNTLTTGDQQTNTAGSVAMDGDSNYVVTWLSIQQDGVSSDVYARRYNATGVAQGAEFRVNTTSTDNLSQPVVEMNLAGNFVITWGSPYVRDVYARCYDAAGVAQGGDFRVNTTMDNGGARAAVAMDKHGNFVITWSNFSGVFAQRYQAAGVAQGGEFYVDNDVVWTNPSVAMDAEGNFVVTWGSRDNQDIYARRYNTAGEAQGGKFRVNTTTEDAQTQPKVAMDAVGNFIVTWDSEGINYPGQDGSGGGVYAQRYNATGVIQGAEFRVNTTTIGHQRESDVAMDEAGNFVVTWQSIGQDGEGHGVYAQQYNVAGVAVGDEFRVNTTTAGEQLYAAVAMDSAGDFVVTWESYAQDGIPSQNGWDVYAQRFATVPNRMRRLVAPAFNGIGADIQIELSGVPAQSSVNVYAGATLGQFGSPVTFTNTEGATNWSFGLDLNDISGQPPIAQYVVIDGPPSMTIVSVTALHPSLSGLTGYTTITPSATSSPPLSLEAYKDVAKVGRWNWAAGNFDWGTADSKQLLGGIDWSKPTILLTHGWNDKLLGNGDSPIKATATRFKSEHPNDYGNYNLLGVDWNDGGSLLGSNPNGLPSPGDILLGVAGYLDAQWSALNAQQSGRALAWKIDQAMKDWAVTHSTSAVAQLTLIGHSNGAGFMGSMAIQLSSMNGNTPIVEKLVALDAPRETSAWGTVKRAAAYIPRVENYYIPLLKKVENISDLGIKLGFGAAMVSAPNVVNLQLNKRVTGRLLGLAALSLPAHSEVFARYAQTVDLALPNMWGFSGSENCGVLADGFIWTELDEPVPGHFVSDQLFRSQVEEVKEEFANDTLRLARTTVDLVETGAIDAIEGFNELTHIAQNTGQKVKNILSFTAQSPALSLMDVAIPPDADALSFDLSVLDSGNHDLLLVGMNNDVLNGIDLDAVLQGGTTTFAVPVGQYAGTTSTLAFFMPSDEPSDAQFVVSNVRFLTLNKPPIAEVLPDKTVLVGQPLTFTATATDSDGDTVQFFLDDTAPEGASIDPQTGVFTWTPPSDQNGGIYPVTIWIADTGPGNPVTEMTVLITVHETEPPVIGAFDNTVAYTENGPAVLLDTNATVTDIDAVNLDTGTLTFNLIANAEATDRLEFRKVTRLIGMSGTNVTFRGTIIGSFTGGIGTEALVITLNAKATLSGVQALLRNVTYRSVSANPLTAPRTVRVSLTDGGSGTSNLPTKTINVTAVPIPPFGSAPPAPSVAENQPSVATVSPLSANDSEYAIVFIDTPISEVGRTDNDQNREYLLSFLDDGDVLLGRKKRRRSR